VAHGDIHARRALSPFSIALVAIATAISTIALVRALVHDIHSVGFSGAPRALAGACAGVATVLGIVALAVELRRSEPRPRRFAPLRILFYVAVATWLGFLVFAQPYDRAWLEIAATIAAGAFAASMAAEALFARIPPRVRRIGDVVLFNLLACVVVGELGLRALAAWKPSPVFASIGGTPLQRLEEQREKPGELRYGFPCNSGGHYDDEFHPRRDGEHLAVTIGDSFSYGVVPHAFHFTTVCERLLGVPVDNMGFPCTGPPEYAYVLEHEALPLRPEVVVIDIFVGNDLVFPYDATPTLDPFLRTWLDRRNALVFLVPERLLKIAREMHRRTRDQTPVGMAQGELASREILGADALLEKFPWLADPMQEQPVMSEPTYTDLEVVRALSVCCEDSPSLRLFYEFMLAMKRMVGDTPLAVMLIPDEFQVDDAVWQSVLAETPTKHLERDRAQRIVGPWLAENGIPCLDLLPRLRAVPPLDDGKRHVYHVRDTHFNARGNRIAGEALAEFLRSHWPRACEK
jgi:hypothetical protein